jgi:hypothetical protein
MVERKKNLFNMCLSLLFFQNNPMTEHEQMQYLFAFPKVINIIVPPIQTSNNKST